MDAVERLPSIGYETLKLQKIMNHPAKDEFKEFLSYVNSSKFKLRTLFFNIDWSLLFTHFLMKVLFSASINSYNIYNHNISI